MRSIPALETPVKASEQSYHSCDKFDHQRQRKRALVRLGAYFLAEGNALAVLAVSQLIEKGGLRHV